MCICIVFLNKQNSQTNYFNLRLSYCTYTTSTVYWFMGTVVVHHITLSDYGNVGKY